MKTLRYFNIPARDEEEMLSVTQGVHYLSDSWLKRELNNRQWWKLGMTLIRCCKRSDINTVHKVMEDVANYNHTGMCCKDPLLIGETHAQIASTPIRIKY